MNPQANLVLRGAFFGSLMIIFLCCILTTGNTSGNPPTKALAAAEKKEKPAAKAKDSRPCRPYPFKILHRHIKTYIIQRFFCHFYSE